MTTIEVNNIVSAVAEACGVTVEEITSLSRKREIVVARQLAMSEVRRQSGFSTGAVGRIFNRDHATVIYSCSAIEKAKSVHDPYLMGVLDNYKSVKNKYNDASR